MATKRLTKVVKDEIIRQVKFFHGVEISNVVNQQFSPNVSVSLLESCNRDITYAIFDERGELLVGFGYNAWCWIGADCRKDFWSMIGAAKFSDDVLKDTIFVVSIDNVKEETKVWPVMISNLIKKTADSAKTTELVGD